MRHSGSPQIKEFAISPKGALGYDCKEVDRFFRDLADDYELLRKQEFYEGMITSTSIRTKTFGAQRSGYLPADVDRALDRVEDKFAYYERHNFIRVHGLAPWEKEKESEAALIMGRLDRKAGQRFRRPSEKLTKGYYIDDVDALCNSLKAHLRGSEQLSPQLIRNSAFRMATGEKCYEETQVDAFLDRAIALMIDLKN